jgi:hypothetical protein
VSVFPVDRPSAKRYKLVAMKLYTLKQAARLSRIHRVTLQRWIGSGKAKPSYTVNLEGKALYLFTPAAAKRLRGLKER